MTNTYNTRNALGSTDPRDLLDNASNLDDGMNSALPTFTDRLGVSRDTWAGMQNTFDTSQTGRENAFTLSQADKESRFQAFLVSSGYVSKGNYAASVVLSERNEYVAVNAATTGTSPGLYRPNASAALPLTLTGTWATDSANLVLLGDDVLRQDLANPAKGAAMVARGVVVVDSIADLRALNVSALKDGQVIYLTEEGRSGEFVVKSGVAPADPYEGIYIALSASLYAERVVSGPYYARWFGPEPAMPGVSQLSRLQSCIDMAGRGAHIIIDEPYWIDATENAIFQSYGGLIPLDYQTIEFVGDGELLVIPNASGAYSCIQGYNIRDLTLLNPRLTGDLLGHTGTNGEWGHGIFLITCYNLKILGGVIRDMWGDGIDIISFKSGSTNAAAMPADYIPGRVEGLLISGCKIRNCGRQGISIEGVENFVISHNNIAGIKRTDPAACIDCEPSGGVSDININGAVFGNVLSDSQIGFMSTGGNTGISVTGNTILNCLRGVQLEGEGIVFSGNTISMLETPYIKESLLNGGICIGSLTKGNISNNLVQVEHDGQLMNPTKFISNKGSVATSFKLHGNVFHTNSAIASGEVPACSNFASIENNTFNLGPSSGSINLTADGLIYLTTNYFADRNVFNNESSLSYVAFNTFTGVLTKQRGFQTYNGPVNITFSNDPNLLNEKTRRYTVVSPTGLNNTTGSVIVQVDISGDFSGLTGVTAMVTSIGVGDGGADKASVTGKLKSVSDTLVEVELASQTTINQYVRCYIEVSGVGRSS